MNTLANPRYHLLKSTPASILGSLCGGNPLYIHGRTPMAEMAVVRSLADSFMTDQLWLSFPEQDLHLAMEEIGTIHVIEIDHPLRPCLALEVAARDEPCSVSFAAIHCYSDLTTFRNCLSIHPSDEIPAGDYDEWRREHFVKSHQCPCCEEAAEIRRRAPETGPLAKILQEAIDSSRKLRCRLFAEAFRFGGEISPSELHTHSQRLTLIGDGQLSMLEIDPGICYSIAIRQQWIDAEPYTALHVCNSLGRTELIIETPGFDVAKLWAGLGRR